MQPTSRSQARTLLLASPVIALAALAVKLEDRGPVLYRDARRQERCRLRAAQAADDGRWRRDDGGRPLGQPRRRTHHPCRPAAPQLSLDELPQLWNVVRGEMSVIGPRPTLRYQVEQYDERQRHRLDVKPGITRLAQVNGRAELPWAEPDRARRLVRKSTARRVSICGSSLGRRQPSSAARTRATPRLAHDVVTSRGYPRSLWRR